MKIFRFAKNLAARLMTPPPAQGGPKSYAPNAGNVFFALFAAVGMVGAVGYGFNTVMRGPVAAMTETTRRTVAESTIITSSRLAIVGATTQQTGSGDTDSDGFIEPVPFRDAATGPHPTGGGYLPAALNIPNTLDPWNTEYGYCAWDHGTVTASTGRLAGSPNNNRYAIAIVSAGKDRRFQTSCHAYVDDTTELIQRASGSDDIVLAYTYAEANNLGNGLWKPKTSDPTTAVTDKNIDVEGRGTVANAVVLSGNTTTGGGLILPQDPGDDSLSGPCNGANDNQLRYNIGDGSSVPVIEICDNGGLGWSPVSGGAGNGGAGGGGGTTTGQLVAHWKLDEVTGTTAVDETGNHNGTLYNNPQWAPGQGKVGGALRFTASDNAYIRVPRTAALEPSSVSVAMWVRRSGLQQTYAGLMTKTWNNNNSPTHHSYGFFTQANSDDSFWWSHGHTGVNEGSTSTQFMTDNQWFHVVGVYDPAGPAPQSRFYVNGILNASMTHTAPIVYDTTNTGDLYIGTTQAAGGEKFNGYIDDVRVYNFGLTTEEVLELYNSVNPTTIDLSAPRKPGSVFSWGRDSEERLGNGATETHRQSPGPVLNGTNVVQIEGGYDHACSVKADGTAWCWGSDSNGKLGNGSGTTTNQSQPSQVSNIRNVIKISAGYQHSCALQNTGNVWCWGLGTSGELGNGGTSSSDIPVRVGIANAIDVATGLNVSCAVTSDGSAWCWGRGGGSQLGNGTTSNTSTPVRVSNVSDFVSISIGGIDADEPVCAVTKRGIGYCWGTDTAGQLGNGAVAGTQGVPSEIDLPEDFVKIDVNGGTACGLRASGKISCWGNGTTGELGNGASSDSPSPVEVTSTETFIEVAVSDRTVCGVTLGGTTYCWGFDGNGALGNGETTTSNSNLPSLAKISNAMSVSGGGNYMLVLSDVSAKTFAADSSSKNRFSVAASESNALHACFIKDDGTMWCWGLENNGEIGNGGGSTDTVESPALVTDPGPWYQVTTGADHTCGIKVDGSAWCWGNDASGQLGNGATAGDQVTPTPVTNTETISWSQLSAGVDATCGIKANGALWCWGDDGGGRLGNGAGGTSTTPTQVTSTVPWKMVSMGNGGCGIKMDNTLWCWGPADNGRLGNGTTTPEQQSPIQIGTDTWKYIMSENNITCGIKTDGSLWCWGYEENGRLGNGSSLTADQSSPSLVVEPGPWATVSSGNYRTCGTKMDGTGWCWGGPSDTLGYGGTNPAGDTPHPRQIVGQDWALVDGGGTVHKCGIKNDNSVWCWGDDYFGLLGNGLWDTSSNYPLQIYQPYKSNFPSVDSPNGNAVSPVASLAIGSTYLTDTEGEAQGLTFEGLGRSVLLQDDWQSQLFIETTARGGATQIGLTADAQSYYMGYNAYTGGLEFGYGQDWLTEYPAGAFEINNEGFVGIGTGGAPVAPLDVRGAVRVGDAGAACSGANAGTIQYSGGEHTYCDGADWVPFAGVTGGTIGWETGFGSITASEATSCGLRTDGTGYCWGSDADGKLGNGAGGDSTVPSQLAGTSGWIMISTAEDHGCGIKSDKSLWCWGDDIAALGLGSLAVRQSPQQVGSATWKMVSANESNTCGIQTNGRAYCWGVATNGVLGNNTTTPTRTSPVEVADGAGAVPGWSDWIDISTGKTSVCAIRATGQAYCWGSGASYKLGNAAITNYPYPTPLHDTTTATGFTDWVKMSVGELHACGLRANGEAYCWGSNGDGHTGIGVDGGSAQRPTRVHNTSSSTPFTDWVAIAASEKHSCGIRATGLAYCWGEGANGKLGTGGTGDRTRPTLVTGSYTDWISIAPGEEHTCAMRANGTAWCWGSALSGVLGNGTTTPSLSAPGQVSD